MAEHKSTFNKGIDQDTSKNKYSNDKVFNAENLRLVADSNNTMGIYENILGILDLQNATDGNNLVNGKIVGHCMIRDELYVFTRYYYHFYPANEANFIYKIILDDTENYTVIQIYSADTTALFLTVDSDLKCIGRYENDLIKKIYFIDRKDLNYLRVINVADPPTNNTNPGFFDILPNFVHSKPKIDSITSGNLNSGMVQYAYKLYNKYGSETLFSPPSELYHISSSDSTSSDIMYVGNNKGVSTSRGFIGELTIATGYETMYDHIQIIAIQYEEYNTTPSIRIIQDSETNGLSTIIFMDGGDSLGSYSLEEYEITSSLFIAKDIATKNNYLFASNIIEQEFDVTFDARAYRFNGVTLTALDSGNFYPAYVYGNPDTSVLGDRYILILNGATKRKIHQTNTAGAGWLPAANTSTNWTNGWDLPDNYNCINKYNDQSLVGSAVADEICMFSNPSFVLGGSGINVSYTISSSGNITDDSSATPSCYTSNNSGYSNPLQKKYSGYRRGEVYRFGIVFFDSKGRKSKVKWIGDIKFPFANTGSSGLAFSAAQGIYSLSVTFTLSSMPVGVTSYQFVRTPITSLDRTVLTSGGLGATVYGNPGGWAANRCLPYIYPTSKVSLSGGNLLTQVDTIYKFISPEISFFKSLTWKSGDKLVIDGYYSNDLSAGVNYETYTNGTYLSLVGKARLKNKTFSSITMEVKNITSGQILNPELGGSINAVQIGGYTYLTYNRAYLSSDNSASNGCGGTSLFIEINSAITSLASLTAIGYNTGGSENSTSMTGHADLLRGSYVRPNASQYGGNKYVNRLTNNYIPISDIYLSSDLSAHVIYGGDAFSGMFEYLNVFGDKSAQRNIQANVTLELLSESYINLKVKGGFSFNRAISGKSTAQVANEFIILYEETAGTKSTGGGTDVYIQSDDLYVYNSVYSQETSVFQSLANLPSNISNFDTRVKYSDKKTNGEFIDSWCKFRVGNYRDVDSTYGPINNIVNFRNEIFYFQDKAFGNLPVEQRSQIQDNNLGSLVIGTGGVLPYFSYISIDTGNTDPDGLILSEVAIYWIDKRKKEINKFDGQQFKPISRDGIQTYLNQIDFSSNTVFGIFDRDYKDVLISISNDKTIVFNELFGVFSGFYTFVPQDNKYLDIGKGVHSYFHHINPSNSNDMTETYLFRHNSNINGVYRCNFYNISYPSILELIINPNGTSINRYDIIKLLTQVFDTNGIELQQSLYSIQFTNDYQDSGEIVLTPGNNIIRRFRLWKMNILRDQGLNRLKDSYLKIKLKFNNDYSNKRILINDVTTIYEPLGINK